MLNAVKPALMATPAQEAPPQQPATRREQNDDSAGLVAFTQEADLTAEALDLLKKADNDGVPAFMTENLTRIARENGVQVSPEMTPNDVIGRLRERV
jgi:hypothetical protein